MMTPSSHRGRHHRSRSRKPPVTYGTHWAVYVGIVLLALVVAAIAAAAILTR